MGYDYSNYLQSGNAPPQTQAPALAPAPQQGQVEYRQQVTPSFGGTAPVERVDNDNSVSRGFGGMFTPGGITLSQPQPAQTQQAPTYKPHESTNRIQGNIQQLQQHAQNAVIQAQIRNQQDQFAQLQQQQAQSQAEAARRNMLRAQAIQQDARTVARHSAWDDAPATTAPAPGGSAWDTVPDAPTTTPVPSDMASQIFSSTEQHPQSTPRPQSPDTPGDEVTERIMRKAADDDEAVQRMADDPRIGWKEVLMSDYPVAVAGRRLFSPFIDRRQSVRHQLFGTEEKIVGDPWSPQNSQSSPNQPPSLLGRINATLQNINNFEPDTRKHNREALSPYYPGTVLPADVLKHDQSLDIQGFMQKALVDLKADRRKNAPLSELIKDPHFDAHEYLKEKAAEADKVTEDNLNPQVTDLHEFQTYLNPNANPAERERAKNVLKQRLPIRLDLEETMPTFGDVLINLPARLTPGFAQRIKDTHMTEEEQIERSFKGINSSPAAPGYR